MNIIGFCQLKEENEDLRSKLDLSEDHCKSTQSQCESHKEQTQQMKAERDEVTQPFDLGDHPFCFCFIFHISKTLLQPRHRNSSHYDVIDGPANDHGLKLMLSSLFINKLNQF